MTNTDANLSDLELKMDEIISARLDEDRKVFKSLLDNYPISSLNDSNRLVTGRILQIFQKQQKALVEVVSEGSVQKTQAFVPLDEFRAGDGTVAQVVEGAEYTFFVESLETPQSVLSLSRSKVAREESWLALKKAYQNNETVEGIVFYSISGGLCVDFNGIIGFLPGSQIDIRIVKDVSPIMYKVQPFKIISIDEVAKTLIISRRLVLEEYRFSKKANFLDKIQEGDIISGTVKNITNYGVFIDLGVMDGLLHIADIAWKKISHPSEVLAIGDVIKVKVLTIDTEKKRISLGMKQLVDNPWESLKEEFKAGTKVKGEISNITDYGIFISIKANIEGLIHQSEISWTKEDTQEFLKNKKIGDEIEAVVLNLDIDNHRISLSIKQLLHNPWKEFCDAHKAGDVIEGQVVNVANFGLIVKVSPKISGFVHTSDITWDQVDPDLSAYKVGDAVKAVYLSGDPEKQRVSLGIKQLSTDPFEEEKNNLKVGSVVTATVSSIKVDGIEVRLFDKISCYIKKAHLAKDKDEQRLTRFVVGDKIDVVITKVDLQRRLISVSIRKLEEEKYKELIKKYGSLEKGATLKDILGGDAASEE